jgi:hypothetical protein
MTMDFSPECRKYFIRAALIALAVAVILILGLWAARIIGLESIWIAALAIFYLEFCVVFAYYYACKFAARPFRAAFFGFLCIVFWNYFVIASAIAIPVMIGFVGLLLIFVPAVPLLGHFDLNVFLGYLAPECMAFILLALFLPFLFYYLAVLGVLIWRAILFLMEKFRRPKPSHAKR